MSERTVFSSFPVRSLAALAALLALGACMTPPKPVVKARQSDATRAPQGAYDSADAGTPTSGSYAADGSAAGANQGTDVNTAPAPKRNAGSAREYVESFEHAR